MRNRDIRELAAEAPAFRERLNAIKRAEQSPSFDWYPYDSFMVFPVLTKMLGGERRDLVALAGAAPILDLGCGDGNLSFFFESLGCGVSAIDAADPNYNRTQGFRVLKKALGSAVDFEAYDLDTGLRLDGRTFGLALCLGVLYHLKNPFGFLETLARHARYCILSTRIAAVTVRGTAIAQEPVAYLLDSREANNDSSNYWIFSEAGLRRLLDRTGWDLCDYTTTGCQDRSNPRDTDRDQRAFCMLSSKLADPWLDVDLDGGWHAMEQGCWRWTERAFQVRIKPEASPSPELMFRFRLPQPVFEATGPVRLQVAVDGELLPACAYSAAGEHVYRQPVPEALMERSSVTVRFELDRALPPGAADRRELGVQVVFWSNEAPQPRALRPITLGKQAQRTL